MGFNSIKVNNTDTNYTHSIFDISEYNSGAIYANLSAALAAVPQNKQQGGMSVKFIQQIPARYSVVKTENLETEPTGTLLSEAPYIDSGTYADSQLSTIFSTLPSDIGAGNALTYYVAVTVDETTTYTSWVITKVQNSVNKYMQYRLMANVFNPNVNLWQGINNTIINAENSIPNGEAVYFKNSLHDNISVICPYVDKIFSSITVDSKSKLLVVFSANFHVTGNTDSEVYEYPYVAFQPDSNGYEVPNANAIILNLKTRQISVSNVNGLNGFNNAIANNSSVILLFNLWGKPISPIASVQAELALMKETPNILSSVAADFARRSFYLSHIQSNLQISGGVGGSYVYTLGGDIPVFDYKGGFRTLKAGTYTLENGSCLYLSTSSSELVLPDLNVRGSGGGDDLYLISQPFATQHNEYLIAANWYGIYTPFEMFRPKDTYPKPGSYNEVYSIGLYKLMSLYHNITLVRSGANQKIINRVESNISSQTTVFFNYAFVITGNVDSAVRNISFVGIEVADIDLVNGYTLPNVSALVFNLSTKQLSVVTNINDLNGFNNVLSDANNVILMFNLLGKLISPIASLQDELYRVQVLDYVFREKLGIEDLDSELGDIGVGDTSEIVGNTAYNNLQINKGASAGVFNTEYYESLVTTGSESDLLFYAIPIKPCKKVKVFFTYRSNKTFYAALYFMKNNSWIDNEHFTQSFCPVALDNPCTELNGYVERDWVEGADELRILLGNGGTHQLPNSMVLQVAKMECVMVGASEEVEPQPTVTTIVVDAAGGGDFTSVRDAVVSITDATAMNRYKIFVKDGLYNEIDIKTKNYVDIVGESRDNTILYCDGTRTDNSPADYNWRGNEYRNVPINTIPKAWKHLFIHMSNSTISNMTLKCNMCKYVIHQDNESPEYEAIVRNCTFIREENYADNVGDYDQGLQYLIGVGARRGQFQRYYDCDFITNTVGLPDAIRNGGVIWHNWNGANGEYKAGMTLGNCYFFGVKYIINVCNLKSYGEDDEIILNNVAADRPISNYIELTTNDYYDEHSVEHGHIKLNITNCPNLDCILLNKGTDLIKDSRNPFAMTKRYTTTALVKGQPVDISDNRSTSIATTAPFGVVLEGVAANKFVFISPGHTFMGLCVSGTYAIGDEVYISDGKFTKTQTGNAVGKAIEAKTLSADGEVMIEKY